MLIQQAPFVYHITIYFFWKEKKVKLKNHFEMLQHIMLNAVITVANLNTLTLMLDLQVCLENPNRKLTRSMKIKLQYQCN